MTATRPSISLPVLTCEWPEALDIVLEALAARSDQSFDSVVADDGSGAGDRFGGRPLELQVRQAARPCVADGRGPLARAEEGDDTVYAPLRDETERSTRIEAVEGLRALASELAASGSQLSAYRVAASSSSTEPVKL